MQSEETVIDLVGSSSSDSDDNEPILVVKRRGLESSSLTEGQGDCERSAAVRPHLHQVPCVSVSNEHPVNKENSRPNKKRDRDGIPVASSSSLQQTRRPLRCSCVEEEISAPAKRGPGRPRGSKDTKPRTRRRKQNVDSSHSGLQAAENSEDDICDLTTLCDRGLDGSANHFSPSGLTDRPKPARYEQTQSLKRSAAIARAAPLTVEAPPMLFASPQSNFQASTEDVLTPPPFVPDARPTVSAQKLSFSALPSVSRTAERGRFSAPPASNGPPSSCGGQQHDSQTNLQGAEMPPPPKPTGPVFTLPPQHVWGQTRYPDLRPWMVKELFKLAKSKDHQVFNYQALHNTLRALMRIALHRHPICKLDAAQKLAEVGAATVAALKAAHKDASSVQPPRAGKHATTAAAGLVALLEWEEEKGEGVACSRTELVRRIKPLIDSNFPGSTLCAVDSDVGWLLFKKLLGTKDESTHLIRERQLQGQPCFELRQSGRDIAERLRQRPWHIDCCGPFAQLQSDDGCIAAACEGAVLAVDFREGGASKSKSKLFSDLCDALDRLKVPYVARSLSVADYLWFCHGDHVAPVLVERKSAADVAHSIHDGRWEAQQDKMLQARHVYKESLRLIYLIEGDPRQYVVSGTDFVADSKLGVTVDEVTRAVNDLKTRGFEVIQSRSISDTVKKLCKIHEKVAEDARSGRLGPTMPYIDFEAALKAAPTDVSAFLKPQALTTEQIHGSSGGWSFSACNPAASDGARPSAIGNQPRRPSSPSFPAPHRPVSPKPSALHVASSSHKLRAEPPGSAAAGTAPVPSRLHPSPQTPPPSLNDNRPGDAMGAAGQSENDLMDLSNTELQHRCQQRGEAVTGSRRDLVQRLMATPKPPLWVARKRSKQHAPKVDSANCALLVALLLHGRAGGLEQKELMDLAEDTGISREPMHTAVANRYNGWSNSKRLREDPPLVKQQRKNKGHAVYSLTPEGELFADEMHRWAHREQRCQCGART